LLCGLPADGNRAAVSPKKLRPQAAIPPPRNFSRYDPTMNFTSMREALTSLSRSNAGVAALCC